MIDQVTRFVNYHIFSGVDVLHVTGDFCNLPDIFRCIV